MTYEPKDKETAITAPPKFDPEDYKQDWADSGMDQEQLNEYLEVLWNIAQTFVLMGFNADISQIMLSHIADISGPDSEKLLEMKHTKNFNGCTDERMEEREG